MRLFERSARGRVSGASGLARFGSALTRATVARYVEAARRPARRAWWRSSVSDDPNKRPGASLAARFRQAHEERERAKAEQAAKQAEAERARAARAALLDDLLAFADATGFVTGARVDGGVRLALGDRELRFIAEGDADRVAVSWTAQPQAAESFLYREALLGHRWIWRYLRPGREHRVPLFDQGLELLLTEALALPPLGR